MRISRFQFKNSIDLTQNFYTFDLQLICSGFIEVNWLE